MLFLVHFTKLTLLRHLELKIFRSSHSHMFFKIGTLQKIAKFTRKHLRQSFNKVAWMPSIEHLLLNVLPAISFVAVL